MLELGSESNITNLTKFAFWRDKIVWMTADNLKKNEHNSIFDQ